MASKKQTAQRNKFKAAFKACRERLATGKTFGKCMSTEMGGKRRRKAKKARRK